MKGRVGSAMTSHKRPGYRPPSDYEHAPVTCPVCYSVPKQPCRRVLKSPGSKLKLGAPMLHVHPERRKAAGLPPVPRDNVAKSRRGK
jgi:hypothetical protein